MPDARLSRNPLSLAGAWLTTLSAFSFLTYLGLSAFGLIGSPYAGIFGFVFLPACFLFGLALIPLGMWREGRRRRAGKAPWEWPAVNLGLAGTRRVAAVILLLTLVNLGIVAIAGTGAAHYMESNQFCGQVCHTPMQPEFASHQVSPHARVECVACHVAPGAAGFVTAKLNGTRQLFLVATGGYSRPIPSPRDRMPRAAETCAECHTPGRPDREVLRTYRTYADDEESTETVSTMTMLVAAIHWHARPDVQIEYVATDEAGENIPYIRVVDPAGRATEYFAEGTTSRPAGTLRTMDCLDCHNRPAHGMTLDASQAVDQAIARGEISRSLPFAKRDVVAAISETYPDAQAAEAGIRQKLSEAFGANPDTAAAIEAAQRLYRTNVFPAMNVTWGTYTTQLGHSQLPGCFRCHDDGHTASDGRIVRQDCELCHREQ
ncbi:MAG: NapC/NirT family cytochrome c [Vicinamibacterales bacterium]